MALVEQEDTLGRQGFQIDRTVVGLGTAGGEHESVLEQRTADQLWPVFGSAGADQGNVQRAIDEARHQRFGAIFADGEAMLGQLAGQGREDFGQQIGRHGGDEAEADRPVRRAGGLLRKNG